MLNIDIEKIEVGTQDANIRKKNFARATRAVTRITVILLVLALTDISNEDSASHFVIVYHLKVFEHSRIVKELQRRF